MVEKLTQDEKAKRMTDTYPMFEWAPGIPIVDELLPINQIDGAEPPQDTNNNNRNDDVDSINNDDIAGAIRIGQNEIFLQLFRSGFN